MEWVLELEQEAVVSRVQDGRWPAMDGWFLPSGWCYKGKDGGILRDDSKSEVEICPYFLLINHYKKGRRNHSQVQLLQPSMLF